MNSAPVGLYPSLQRLTRRVQRIVLVTALSVSATVASAQNAVGLLAGIAPNPSASPGYTNGAATAAQFRLTNPSGVVVDSAGNVFVADPLNHAIRRIAASDGAVTTFAGSATGVSGTADGTTTDARFSAPQGLAIDGANNIYVADSGNHAIRRITSGGVVTTLAGTAGAGFPTPLNGYVNNATGSVARFNQPLGIAADRPGGGVATNVYVADTQNNVIRQVVVATGAVTTVAGITAPATTSGNTNGAGTDARFNHPDGIASNAAGTTLYVADTFNHLIRQITIAAGPTITVGTLAGSGTQSYGESTGTSASFNNPTGITLDSGGNVIVVDTGNHVIRSITAPGGVTTLLAGSPLTSGYVNGLALNTARFNVPSGVATFGTPAVYFVADTNNQVIRRISAATAPAIQTNPQNQSVTVNGTVNFTVAATGSPAISIQWQRSTDSGNSWQDLGNTSVPGTSTTASGVTTTQLTLSNVSATLNNNQFRAVVTNGVNSPVSSTAAALTVNSPPVITNNTFSYFFNVGQAGSFTVTATGTPTPTFVMANGTLLPPWAQLNSTTGVVSGTPDNSLTPNFTFSIAATSSAGTSTPVQFNITIQTGPVISGHPANQSVTLGQIAQFFVTASSNPAISSYQWERSTNSGLSWFDIADSPGAVSGATTASLTLQTTSFTMNGDQYRVRVTNAVGTSTSNAASLTVSQAPLFTSAATATFVVNQPGITFQVQASGSPTPTYGVIGTLPPWANFNSTTGLLSGMPTDALTTQFNFTFTATNSGGTVNQPFALIVSPTPLAPAITTQPANQTLGLGQNAVFTVVATGNPTPTYQWQRFRVGDPGFVALTEGGAYSGTATATLTITNVTTAMSGDLYQVVLSNTNGAVTSSQAQLTLTLGTIFTTVAGQPLASGFANGTGSAARFNAPNSVAIDSTGTAYVADASNHVIRKVTAGGVVTTLAGTAGAIGSTDGFAADARFNTPSALALDSAGNIYVADSGNNTIRRVTSVGVVTTVAGSPGSLGTTDGIGNLARFAFPTGIAVDSFGTIYVSDKLTHLIRKITPGNAVQTFVFASAGLSFPGGLAVDSGFNLYVADSRNHVIRKVSPGGAVTTLAGIVGSAGSLDGNGSAARFNQPEGVGLDSAGNVYVADTLNHTIRRIAVNGDVTTIAGLPLNSGTSDGSGTGARFNQPYSIAVDTSGNIWVTDTFNHTIRRSGGLAAPQITTSPVAKSVTVGETATFTVAASGSPTPGIQWQRRPVNTGDFANIQDNATYVGVNTATLTVLNTTLEMSGDEFRAFANNLVEPIATSSGAILTVSPAQVTPSITVQPVGVNVNVGDGPTFSVTAIGTAPLTYQWRKDGQPINGATSSSYFLPFALPASAGLYTVTVSNAFGSVTSNAAALSVNTAPIITTQPRSEVSLAGFPVTFSVAANGASPISYQWRKNGVPIPGAASSPVFVLVGATASDAGNYDVIASNGLGSAQSSLAQLTITAGPLAPSFTSHPASRTVAVGAVVTLSASAAAAPAATYQWRKDGTPISGANNPTYTIASAQFGDAGGYDVVATNSAGTATSLPALLQIITRSYAGTYFGSFAGGLGNFAMYIRPDNTGVFLGYLPGSTAPVMSLNVVVNNSGQFTFTQAAVAADSSAADGQPARAAALSSVSVSGSIASDGSISGSLGGGASASFSANRIADGGSTGNLAGFYQAGVGTSGAVAYTILSANGQAFSVAQVGAVSDGGLGSVNSGGQVSIPTGRSTINATVTSSSGAFVGSVSGALNSVLSGASETTLGTQRLANISSRARVGSGNSVAIAGFVISGSESKPVLIRAVGPSLATVGVTGTLANPKLDLNRGQTVIATATGIPAANVAAITAASTRAGAFPLTAGAADSAILTTLSPGAYTVVVSSATNLTGVALVEVYDLSAPAAGQKLLNISTRADAGTNENTLIAGVVVTGAVPKRVLIRGIGPGLTQLSLTGVLPRPTLTLVRNDQTPVTVASNTGWSTSLDAAAITAAGLSVGAFPMLADDAAMVVSLSPGNYTAQVNGAGGASGIALIEVYELP